MRKLALFPFFSGDHRRCRHASARSPSSAPPSLCPSIRHSRLKISSLISAGLTNCPQYRRGRSSQRNGAESGTGSTWPVAVSMQRGAHLAQILCSPTSKFDLIKEEPSRTDDGNLKLCINLTEQGMHAHILVSLPEMGTVAQSCSFSDSEVPLGVHFLYSKSQCLTPQPEFWATPLWPTLPWHVYKH